jgi:lipopolysaccharide biosynthesis regulator YciM
MKMKKLGIDELFMISEIADKMDIDIPLPKQVNVAQMKKDKKTQAEIDDALAQAQSDYGGKLISMLVKKAYKAKDEIKELIRVVTGKEPNDMEPKELLSVFTSILKQDGATEAFKSADK